MATMMVIEMEDGNVKDVYMDNHVGVMFIVADHDKLRDAGDRAEMPDPRAAKPLDDVYKIRFPRFK